MFIDTNVLVYARVEESDNHDRAREALRRVGEYGEPLRISRQIVREYLAVVTRQRLWRVALTMDQALMDALRLIGQFEILPDGPSVTNELIALCRRTPVRNSQIHDANIVATMLARGERRLLTFNVRHFRRYEGLIELMDA